jgi:F0F1-type ATP synthase epsilon subunit
MKLLAWLLVFFFVIVFVQVGHCQGLTDPERREILQRLGELSVARDQIKLLNDYVAKDKDQDQREKQLSDRELQLAHQETQIAQKETQLAKQEAADYKAAYDSVTQRGGVGYTLCKVFSLGLARCR